MIRHASRVQRLERDLEAAVDAELEHWRPQLDAAVAAAQGAWGEAVRARGVAYLEALDANDPPVPAGVDPLVLRFYLEAAESAAARLRGMVTEATVAVRGMTDGELLDAINKHPMRD